MKSIISLIVILLLTISTSYARWIYEKELPSKFRQECFEYASSYNFLKQDDAKYKIELNKSDTIAVKDWYIVPIIPYKIKGLNYDYTTSNITSTSYWNDNNASTFYEIDTEKDTEILLTFNEPIKRNTFGLNFKHSAESYIPELYISEDWTNFSPVSFSSIYDFDIKAVKIKFIQKFEVATREKIKITELSFTQEQNIKLIRVSWWWRIDFYSSYTCRDYINLDTIHVPFAIDVNTPTIKLELKANKDYNPNIDTDADWDSILDYNDNCKDTFNPLQLDTDADWQWDKCSDVDGDGIVWSSDNCPTISNTDQKDINLNNIWDVCEFDKDKDGIYDSVDNCINVPNQLQADSDRDWIGNLCDNCKIFNPKQKDSDGNSIWDVCDLKEKELAENDDDIDWIINWADNCPLVVNPAQNDSDKDWVGDLCDNCKLIQNTNQYDFNKNNVWDICEDSDWDWIEWMQDNCMNVANVDQKDSDNNWIWDVCEDNDNDRIWFAADNCPNIYNPDQKDTDKDWIGNVCDNDDNRVLESNKSIFTVLIILVILLFVIWIMIMIKKLNNNSDNNEGWFTKKEVKPIKKTKPTSEVKEKVKKKIIKKKTTKAWDELFESYTDRKKRESWED